MTRQESLFATLNGPANDLGSSASEERLVTDARAGVSPAQMVENKLLSLLGNSQLPVSRLLAPRYRRPPV